ncbi:MAG: putative lipid II flippase FtsW [Pseudomonadota bacterium]
MTDSRQEIPSSAYDVQLLFPVLFLVGIGIVMVYSASSALALKRFGTDYYFLKKQSIFALMGIVVLVICRHVPYRLYGFLAYPFLALALALLVAIQVSGFGHNAGGATRWLRVGEFSFQPSEFARFALIIYLAYSMDKKSERLKTFSVGLLPHMLVLGALVVLIAIQPDFGAVVILGAITWIMLFIGGVRVLHLLSSLVLFALPVAYLLVFNAEYRIKRLISFLDPWQYSSDAGYQVIHSFMAFGTGGMWGTGIGKSYQKLFYLPEPHTDFIFSVIGEEFGLLGVTIILVLYVLILWEGIIISRNARDPFGAFVGAGLTAAIGLQVCVNMGVVLGLLPTKGLALPFLSYGGSSLLMNMASVGILMNIGALKTR